MSNKMLSVVGALVAGLGFLAATTQGCGSSGSSSADIAASCNKGCKTGVMCSGGLLTMDECVQNCEKGAQSSSGTQCKNNDAIVSKAMSCADMTDCTAFISCSESIPKCDTSGAAGSNGGAGTSGGAGSTGSGGPGSGGSTGSAGTSGGGDCTTTCAKAQTCCTALIGTFGGDAGSCQYDNASLCSAQAGTSGLQACQSVLTSGAQLNPTACK